MKLSIWQKFSSNHSASDRIVEVIPSAEAARDAKQRVNGILLEMADYYAEDENRLYSDAYNHGLISPIEKRLASEYQIEWKEALLWFENTQVKTEKQILIIEPQYPTDSGTSDIEALLK